MRMTHTVAMTVIMAFSAAHADVRQYESEVERTYTSLVTEAKAAEKECRELPADARAVEQVVCEQAEYLKAFANEMHNILEQIRQQ